jgi:hypothetical protein
MSLAADASRVDARAIEVAAASLATTHGPDAEARRLVEGVSDADLRARALALLG